jgi:hypothetical protein
MKKKTEACLLFERHGLGLGELHAALEHAVVDGVGLRSGSEKGWRVWTEGWRCRCG